MGRARRRRDAAKPSGKPIAPGAANVDSNNINSPNDESSPPTDNTDITDSRQLDQHPTTSCLPAATATKL